MSTDLVKSTNSAIQAYLAGDTSLVDNQVSDVDTSAGTYGRFNGNTGVFIIGKDGTAHQPSMWAYHCLESKAQWICWSDGKVVDRIQALIVEGGFNVLPEEHKLKQYPKHKEMDGWKKQIVIPAYDLEGEFGQVEMSFPAESDKRPIKKLIAEWNKHQSLNRSKEAPFFVPVVELGSYTFPSRGGTKYAPILKVDHFMTPAEMDEMVAGMKTDADVDDEAEAPAEPAPKEVTSRFQSSRKGGRTA